MEEVKTVIIFCNDTLVNFIFEKQALYFVIFFFLLHL